MTLRGVAAGRHHFPLPDKGAVEQWLDASRQDVCFMVWHQVQSAIFTKLRSCKLPHQSFPQTNRHLMAGDEHKEKVHGRLGRSEEG